MEELFSLDRFDQDIVNGEASSDPFFLDHCRDNNCGVLVWWLSADGAQDIPAIHIREDQVESNGGKSLLLTYRQRLCPRCGDIDMIASLGADPCKAILIVSVIINNQNRGRTGGGFWKAPVLLLLSW